MKRIGFDPARYAGLPNESVTVDAKAEGGGEDKRVVFTLDGQPAGKGPQLRFPLGSGPGDHHTLAVTFFGEVGQICRVSIGQVNGGQDPDVLLCRQFDPFPTHAYEFVVVADMVTALLAPQPVFSATALGLKKPTKPAKAKKSKKPKSSHK